MQLNVFFLPSSIIHTPIAEYDVYIVIDLIRATTCMTVICGRGGKRIFAAGSVEQARQAKRLYPERLLCGERHSLPLPGFDYGNSPVQFSQAELEGRELIMTTTNGTRAFHACPSNSIRLAGCLQNATAVASQALALAQNNQRNIHLVCAGEEDAFGLDDAVCAGYLAQELQRQARQNKAALTLDESALAAIALYDAYQPPRLIEYSDAARQILAHGLAGDPPFCLLINTSQSVARVTGLEAETGLLILEQRA